MTAKDFLDMVRKRKAPALAEAKARRDRALAEYLEASREIMCVYAIALVEEGAAESEVAEIVDTATIDPDAIVPLRREA